MTSARRKARQMHSPRWLTTLTIPALIGVTLITGSAPATADSRDDGYLNELRGMGLMWPEGHEVPLVSMARTICEDLGWGWTPDRITQDIHATMSGQHVDYAQVAGMVNLARATYCPTQRCWAAHC
jgi:Protein of unknown function (DUF732)